MRTVAAQDPAAERPGGQFKEIRDYPEVPRDQVRRLGDMLRSGNITDQQLFENYYKWRLSRLTWRGNSGQLHDLAERLKFDLRRSAEPALTAFNNLIIGEMRLVAADEGFDPFVRFNAIKLIGDLNQDEGRPGLGDEVPFGGALPVLLELVNGNDKTTIAALLGIRRHAEAGISDANQRTQVARAMLELIAADDRHPWVRRRSAQVLGALRMPGTDRNSTDVADALVGLVVDESASSSLRCRAAASLAGIDFTSAPQTLDYSEIARTLAKLAVDVGKREVDQGGTTKSLRRLIARLHAVDKALLGRPIEQGFRRGSAEPEREGGLVKAAEGTPHADYVDSVAQQVKAMLEPLLSLDSDSESDEVPEEFNAPLKALEESIKPNPPPTSPAGGAEGG